MEFTSTSEHARSGKSCAALMATPPPKEWPTMTVCSSIPTARTNSSSHEAYPARLKASRGRPGVPPKPGNAGANT